MSGPILGVTPWVILSSLITWAAVAFAYRKKTIDESTQRHSTLEMHKDGLTFQLLQNARQEMEGAKHEVEGLREEVRKLRSMEQHFYHFQQALDHLEAILFPEDDNARDIAERNARAFLNRMRKSESDKNAG